MSNKRNTTKARTTRKASKKKVQYTPPEMLEIPEEVRGRFDKEGFRLRWIRFKLAGEEDYKNIGVREREGYVLVKPEEVPEMAGATDEYASIKREKSFVTIGDVALAKIPAELADARAEYYEGIAISQENAVDEGLERNNSEHMPFISRNKSKVGRGKSARFGV
jgi:hypothetical protein